MNPPVVLDSFALLALLNDEPGAQVVQAALRHARDEGSTALVSAINWGEVLYIAERAGGAEKRKTARRFIDLLPVRLVLPDLDAVETAALIKASHPLSYADAFAAGLAQQNGGVLLTGYPEFKSVEKLVRIRWLS